MSARDELRKIAFWAHELSEEEAARALKGITRRQYDAGSTICHKGDNFNAWLGVVSGLVKLGTVSSEGKDITLAGVARGGWLGEGSLIKNEARKYDLVALRDTSVALMARPTFMWLFETSVGFNRFLVRQLNERIGQFIAMVEYDRMLDPDVRVARHIAWLFNPVLYPDAGDSIDMTQEEVGLLSGVGRQTANKALAQLEALGLIVVQRGSISVRDPVRLARFEGEPKKAR